MKPTLRILLATAVSALALSACKDDQRDARIAAPEPPSLAELDALAGLPAAAPIPVRWAGPDTGYGYAERAYDMQRVFYDEPPAYAFDYGGYEPLVWETSDDWVMYAEPWEDSYRYYYYAPYADYPYFIQTDDYGYGYDPTGVLIAVIAVSGAYLSADRYDYYAPLASRYYARGHELYDAGRRAPRLQVTETVWRERAPRVARSAGPWLKAAQTERGWKEWRDKGGPRRMAPDGPAFREARDARSSFGRGPDRDFAERQAREQNREARALAQREAHADRQSLETRERQMREGRAFAQAQQRAQREAQQREAHGRAAREAQAFAQREQHQHQQRLQQQRQAEAHGRAAREAQAFAQREQHQHQQRLQQQRQAEAHGRELRQAREQQAFAERSQRQAQQQEQARGREMARAQQQQARAAEAQGRPAAEQGGGRGNRGGGNPHQQQQQPQAQPPGGGQPDQDGKEHGRGHGKN